MPESISPVCTPEYAARYNLVGNPGNLSNCTLLHDNQAWDYDSNSDEWQSWVAEFQIGELSNIPSVGFDRSDLAVIAAMNNAGVAMGRKSLVEKRIRTGELIYPFPDLEVHCRQRYYVATLPNQHSKKIELFLNWLVEESDDRYLV